MKLKKPKSQRVRILIQHLDGRAKTLSPAISFSVYEAIPSEVAYIVKRAIELEAKNREKNP